MKYIVLAMLFIASCVSVTNSKDDRTGVFIPMDTNSLNLYLECIGMTDEQFKLKLNEVNMDSVNVNLVYQLIKLNKEL